MKFKQALSMLLRSKEYKEWKKKNPKAFLSFGFFETGQTAWQIGFYHPDKDRITSFVIDHGRIIVIPDQEIFKQGKIKKLIPKHIKVEAAAALEKAKDKADSVPLKAFLTIQTIGSSPLWNITMLTPTQTVNVKIDSKTGKITSTEISSYFDYVKNVSSQNKKDKSKRQTPDYIA